MTKALQLNLLTPNKSYLRDAYDMSEHFEVSSSPVTIFFINENVKWWTRSAQMDMERLTDEIDALGKVQNVINPMLMFRQSRLVENLTEDPEIFFEVLQEWLSREGVQF
eukprot:Trichotokara_eunicae@DN10074_c0_g1_i1.p1